MNTISIDRICLSYSKSGSGSNILFAFHGFGQDHKVFQNLSLLYPPQSYTIYSFDLFFHGESTHPYNEEVKKDVWEKMIDKLMIQDGVKNIDIISYSIGCIFSICTFMKFPTQVKSMILIAPDGIKTSPIYSIATSKFGKPLFLYLMKKPYSLIRTLDFITAAGLFPKIFHRFLTLQLKDRRKRMNIYTSWVNFKSLYYDFEELKDSCYRYTPHLTFFLGMKDTVIRSNKIIPFANELPNATVVELQSNHHKMIFETTKYLLKD